MPLNKSLESEVHKLLKMMRAHFANDHPDPDQTLPCKYLDDIEEEINALIQSELKKQRESIRSKLPEKKLFKIGLGNRNSWAAEGYNAAIEDITKILEGLECRCLT